MKTLGIFGSTGSIGNSALSVFSNNSKSFKLKYLATYSNLKKLKIQQKLYKPEFICLLNKKYNSRGLLNLDELLKKNKKKKIDYIVSGIKGYSALFINYKLLKITKNLLIANKESIICGGSFFLNHAKRNNCNIVPIDSEHHCIDTFLKLIKTKKSIKSIYLVASGGPFLNKRIKYNEKIKNVIKHPNWKMGDKISVDSSTFANKVLELFEAKLLFNLKSSQLKIIVEQSSNVHAIIEFNNNIYYSIMHKPNMKLPISNSMNLSYKVDYDLHDLNLKFTEVDTDKFPIVKLGYNILKNYGHAGMIAFNVLNDRIVGKFLNDKVLYGDIPKILVKLFKKKNIRTMLNVQLKGLTDVKKFILKLEEVNIDI